ncbi:MAG: proline dehydrogenase family protein [Acidobacteria bacterium]|nr:proline dehydrogenase family protein [Acidobacteriota bacterium]
MSLARTLLLKASDSTWLREHGTRAPFVRRAVSRFMPGETFDDMLGAARATAVQGIGGVFTRLGENVKDAAEANTVAAHYVEAVTRVRGAGLDCEPSIKLTQLGLDIDREFALGHARHLARAAREAGSFLWVDMEQSPYVDQTLEIVRRLREEGPRVGVCLQAYLLRTPEDLDDMIERGIGVRLVKGAYKEPPTVAVPLKADVDEQYFRLAQRMLGAPARATGGRAVFGTHDIRLIARIREHAMATDVPGPHYEFHMLYGIQREEQLRLARDGALVRVLIAYGPYWFPWYMRRLAERPANVWFVAKNLVVRS